MNTAAIRVEDLNKSFNGFQAVKDVTFEAPEGQITALLGPSGSGKSTVLRVIAGLERPDSGRIAFGGQEQTFTSVQERRVGMVFQHYALFRHMTVRDNIAFGLSVRKEPRDSVRARVDELLNLVQLVPFANRYPDQLSGGQRQRVALARALAPRPKVLLLDEPFGALDARIRQDLRHWLDEIHRELEITSLLVTHDQEEALELAQTVVVMHEGAIEQIGSPQEIYENPQTSFVASFVGAVNIIEGLVIDGHVQFGDWYLAGASHLADGSGAKAYIRPHDVALSTSRSNGSSVPGKVVRVSQLAWITKVRIDFLDDQSIVAEMPADNATRLEPGQEVFVDLRRAKVFDPGNAGQSHELAG